MRDGRERASGKKSEWESRDSFSARPPKGKDVECARMSTRMRRTSVLEQAEAQTAGVRRNAIKKQGRDSMRLSITKTITENILPISYLRLRVMMIL